MIEQILNIIKKHKKSIDAIKIISEIKENYSVEDLNNILSILKELEKEGLIISNKHNKYTLFERSNYEKGILEVTNYGNAYLLMQDEDDIFISKKHLNYACNGDTVIVEKILVNHKIEGKVIKILKRSSSSLLAEVKIKNNKRYVEFLKPLPYKVIINDKELECYNNGDIIKLEIIEEIKNKVYVKVNSFITNNKDENFDILKIMAEFDINPNFPNEVLEEVKLIPKKVTESDFIDRVDLRNKIVFTIDCDDTKDIDDGLSLEILDNNNYLLSVHIADVTHYVKEGSKLKKHAEDIGNSTYLGEYVRPMYPKELSNGICSLNPNEDRCAITTQIEIDKSGNIINSKIFKSVINSSMKMTYSSVDKVLKEEKVDKYEKYKSILLKMNELSQILDKVNEKQGKIEFYKPEIEFIFDEVHNITKIQKRNQGMSANLIENFMILTNEVCMNTLLNRIKEIFKKEDLKYLNKMFIYRIHESPDIEKIKSFILFLRVFGININHKINYSNITSKDIQNILNELKKEKKYEILNTLLLKSMQKAVYSTNNVGHFGLARINYSHFTAPIRRFGDTEMQYIIENVLFNKPNKEFCLNEIKKLPYITEHISFTERNSDECEYEVNNMLIAKYMSHHIYEEYDAIIVSTLKSGFFVETDNMISGFVNLNTIKKHLYFESQLQSYVDRSNRIILTLGDKVKVKCISANVEERKVDFILLE